MAGNAPVLSVEIWPARTFEQSERLEILLKVLEESPVDFVSVTYGALGSDRPRTLSLAERLAGEGFRVVAHLACLTHTEAELHALVRRYIDLGVAGILALRGDAPLEGGEVAGGDLAHAVDLVRLVKGVEPAIPVAVALHPAGHPEAASPEQDLAYSAEKLALADFGITQFFVDGGQYSSMMAGLAGLGVIKPVSAGIIVPASVKQLARMSEMAGVSLPKTLMDGYLDAGSDRAQLRVVGERFAFSLAEESLAAGAQGVHLFSMNSPDAVRSFIAHFAS